MEKLVGKNCLYQWLYQCWIISVTLQPHYLIFFWIFTKLIFGENLRILINCNGFYIKVQNYQVDIGQSDDYINFTNYLHHQMSWKSEGTLLILLALFWTSVECHYRHYITKGWFTISLKAGLPDLYYVQLIMWSITRTE